MTTPQDCDAILRECSAVQWAAPGVDCRMQVVYGNRNWQPWKILGTSPAFLVVRDWALEEGVAFTDEDVHGLAAVCLMGKTPARELFGDESPVGKEVRVRGVPLKVLGVLHRKGANMMGMDQDDVVIVPWTTVKYRINGSKLALQRPEFHVLAKSDQHDQQPVSEPAIATLSSADGRGGGGRRLS